MTSKQPQARTVALPDLQIDRTNQSTDTIDIKLSTLTLLMFNRKYDKWMLFKDAFTTFIHDNRKLSLVQKFQYLRNTLKDEVLEIISILNTSAKNYMIVT